jgi:outer membrane receptor protein involved in Fe transport
VRAAVALVLGTATMLSLAPQVLYGAEEVAAEVELDEVQVTGSRIVRRDTESNSPLVTVEAADLENRSGLNIESYLNQLPEFNPSFSPTTTQGDVQITAVNSVGIAAVSLRGFGPNRNLVLMDGHRTIPTNALMVTDINGIPSAMIKRVEIISGGASATYGADAIGGVTNFIMNDNFEGLEVDAQYGITEAGDGQESRQSAFMGTNFAEGRGNITIGVEHYDRKSALERNRDFFVNSWSDPNVASNDFFLFGYNGYNTGLFAPSGAPSQATLNAVFPNQVPGSGVCGATSFNCAILQGFRIGANGRLFNGGGALPASNSKFEQAGGVIDGVEYARQFAYDANNPTPGSLVEVLKWNNPDALVSAPQTRYSFYGSGKYDITDSLQFFTRATYAESKTRTRLFGTNASFGWEASVPYNPTTDSPISPTLNYGDSALVALAIANPTNPLYANPSFIASGSPGARHPVSVELAALLNSRNAPTVYCAAPCTGPGLQATTDTALVGTQVPGTGRLASWMLETFPKDSFAQRSTLNVNNVWNVETGLRFDLPVKDWSGELYYSHGQSSTYNVAFGNNSLERWRKVIASNDYGRGQTFENNLDGASSGFGSVGIKCTSGFYDMIFAGDQTASQDCKYAVEASLQTRTQNQQDNVELNVQGGLFDLPAGEVRGALGVQYRENAAQFNPDILQSTASFDDQVIGVYPTGYLDASINVKEVYGEMLIPVVSDLPFLKKVELEVGGRYSDYNATKSTFTYKLNGSIEVNDYVRFRGGYNRATRAPNLGELFLNLQEIFSIGGNNFGDPCGLRSQAPYGAGGALPDPVLQTGEVQTQIAPGQTTAGQQSAYLICRAQMGTAGANAFYTQNATGGAGGAFNWVQQKGNPNLDSEKADTYTAGVIFRSPSENPLLSGFTATVDWWKVGIKDAIQQYSIDYANFLCYGAVTVTNATEAAAQSASAACRNVDRNTTSGGAATVLLAYDNQATISTSGVDISLNWRANLSDMGMGSLPGMFGVGMQATVLDYYKTKQSPTVFDVNTDWAGTLGPNLTGTNPGAYRFRLNTAFSYINNNKSINLRWRHLPSVWPAAKASEDAIIKNNQSVAAGGDGILLGYTPGTWIKTKSYNAFDLSGNWDLNSTISVRAGINNLLDTKPRVTGGTNGYPSADYDAAARANVCDAAAEALGCRDPSGPSLGSSGAGTTSAGFYDVLGRSFYVGVKARF